MKSSRPLALLVNALLSVALSIAFSSLRIYPVAVFFWLLCAFFVVVALIEIRDAA